MQTDQSRKKGAALTNWEQVSALNVVISTCPT